MTDRVCVVMPTYNERDNLEPTLTRRPPTWRRN